MFVILVIAQLFNIYVYVVEYSADKAIDSQLPSLMLIWINDNLSVPNYCEEKTDMLIYASCFELRKLIVHNTPCECYHGYACGKRLSTYLVMLFSQY